jgi:hypothetical protein
MRRSIVWGLASISVLSAPPAARGFVPSPHSLDLRAAQPEPPRDVVAGTFLGRRPIPQAHGVRRDGDAQALIAHWQHTADVTGLELLLTRAGGTPGQRRLAFVQAVQGVPVEGTFALAQLRDDALVYAHHAFVPRPHPAASPSLPPLEATQLALDEASQWFEAIDLVGAPSLVILVVGEQPHFAYVQTVLTQEPWGRWRIFVDAQTGETLGIRQASLDAVSGSVRGLIEPLCQGDTRVSALLAHMEWTPQRSTSAAGMFHDAAAHPRAQLRLRGPYVRIEDYQRPSNAWSFSLAAAPAFNDLSLEHVPLAQLDPFVHTLRARAWFLRRLVAVPEASREAALAWVHAVLPVHVNLTGGPMFGCNAFYDGQSLNFYAADRKYGCNNSGQTAKIVYHEYAHGMHHHLTASDDTFDPQVSEGVADFVAASITGDPRLTGLFGCDALLKSRTTWRTAENTYSYCRAGANSACDSGPGDEAHNAAPVLSGALWELRAALEDRYGERRGAEETDALFLRFLALVSDMDSAYGAAIAADTDDDADPSTGTRHSCEINRAFIDARSNGTRRFPDSLPHAVPCLPSP